MGKTNARSARFQLPLPHTPTVPSNGDLPDMKKLLVQVQDDTHTTMVEPVEVRHLSELGDTVKAVIDDFVEANKGAVIPPVTIKAIEQSDA